MNETAVAIDMMTASTLQDDGDICCPTCGSWTTVENLEPADDLLGVGECPLCRG